MPLIRILKKQDLVQQISHHDAFYGFLFGYVLCLWVILLLVACSSQSSSAPATSTNQKSSLNKVPYDYSAYIEKITWDFNKTIRQAPGSDNWAVTWSDDDHQYTTWGDGGGFDGSNKEGRVSLGVGRIEGSFESFRGVNVWGGKNHENPAQFEGKSYSILSVEGVLYMWVLPGSNSNNYSEARLAHSANHGASWTMTGWRFKRSDRIISPAFAQFGKDYSGARDSYIYTYFIGLNNDKNLAVQKPGKIYLARVNKERIMERNGYEFFGGLEDDGAPIWIKEISMKRPVFEDSNGVGWNMSVSYNAGLRRYLLLTEHTKSFQGNLGMFDAPEPWGPWTTVCYYNNWGQFGTVFFWNVSNKWTSMDGRTMHIIFTGTGDYDSFNTIKGIVRLKS